MLLKSACHKIANTGNWMYCAISQSRFIYCINDCLFGLERRNILMKPFRF